MDSNDVDSFLVSNFNWSNEQSLVFDKDKKASVVVRIINPVHLSLGMFKSKSNNLYSHF